MPSVPHWKRLARVAEPLRPARAPFYVDHADMRHPAVGWYWQPAGVDHVAYLGHNHVIAEMKLLQLKDRQAAAA